MSNIAGYIDGHPVCADQMKWIPAYRAELKRRGIPVPVVKQGIGSAAASSSTHLNGCVTDFEYTDARQIWVARQMGADATWHRPYNWDGDKGSEHIHSVLTGGQHNINARYQIDAVRAGYNGLGSMGHAAKDDGPRPLSGRTWEQGIAWATTQQEDDMLTPAQEALLNSIAEDVAWLKLRLAGTTKGTSITDALRWLQDRIGGSTKNANLTNQLRAIAADVAPDAIAPEPIVPEPPTP